MVTYKSFLRWKRSSDDIQQITTLVESVIDYVDLPANAGVVEIPEVIVTGPGLV